MDKTVILPSKEGQVRKDDNMSRDYIAPDDYYSSHGMGGVLLGSKYYSEVESIYSRLPVATLKSLHHIIPVPTDIRWCSALMWIVSNEDKAEKFSGKLQIWLRNQRTYLCRNILSKEKIDALNEFLPGWSESKYIEWHVSLEKLVQFHKKKHRLPKHLSDDDFEARLGKWINNQKASYLGGTLSVQRIQDLDRFLPSWRDRVRERYGWEEMLTKVSMFVRDEGRFPRASNPDEAPMDLWIARQRETRRPLSPSRIAMLDSQLVGWSESNQDRDWMESLNDLSLHIKTYQRLPLDSYLLPHESKTAKWLYFQTRALQLRGVSQKRQELLDSVVPCWRLKRHNVQWLARLEAAHLFVQEKGRFPIQGTNDKIEERLSVFLHHAQKAMLADKLPQDQNDLLKEKFSVWDNLVTTNRLQ